MEFFEKTFGTSIRPVRPISREITLSPLPSLSGSIRCMRPVSGQSAPVACFRSSGFFMALSLASGSIVGEYPVFQPGSERPLRLIDPGLRRDGEELSAAPARQGGLPFPQYLACLAAVELVRL